MMSSLPVQSLLNEWPNAPVPKKRCKDATSERLRQTLLALQHAPQIIKKGSDLAGLLRQWFRERQLSNPSQAANTITVPRAPGWPSIDMWRAHGCSIERENDKTLRLKPLPWSPGWLGSHANSLLEPALRRELRRQDDRVPTDPSFQEQFGYASYLSSGQREAIRAVYLMEEGTTLTIALPTGSGKSAAFFAPAMTKQIPGTVVVVIPTISLALDFERRAYELDESLRRTPLAYHSGLDDDERKAIRARLQSGAQPIIFASPESLLSSLRMALLTAAEEGLLPYLFIDEAHLISQWGNEFRPQFQTLAGLRHAIMARNSTLRTVLMTATLTPNSFETLETLFDARKDDIINYPLIRPEPDYWVKKAVSANEQKAMLAELVRFAPRPFILYTTLVKDAERQHKAMRELGFERIGLLHGKTSPNDRQNLVEQWKERELDCVVATSAFGLGVDQSDVRTVIHACVPETADRYYQEVGRAGRDGRASLSFMIYTKEDHKNAKDLNPSTLISIERGLERWNAMLHDAQSLPDGRMEISLNSRPADVHQDSDANVAWNMRTLILMARAELIRLDFAPPPEKLNELNDADAQELLKQYFRTIEVEFRTAGHRDESEWLQRVGQERLQSKAADAHLLDTMEKILGGESPIGALLSDVYHLPGQDRPGYARGACAYDRKHELHRNNSYLLPVPRPLVLPQQKLSPTLISALGPSLGTILVPYDMSIAPKQLRNRLLNALEHLLRQGIQEIISDDAFLPYLKSIHQVAPNGFIVTRRFADIANEFEAPALPAVSVIGPTSDLSYLTQLQGLKRPLHLLLVPDQTPDPERPDRLWKNIFPYILPFSLLLERLGRA